MKQVYLVGGAVRDIIMGVVPKDYDFVVVGSSPEEMLSLGFSQVGADFPVFLHPHTGDEYALARKERKVSDGHNGFSCEWEGVTLEEDLSRRDLTINAMAVSIDGLNDMADISYTEYLENIPKYVSDCAGLGLIVDPHNGMADIRSKTLRHVGYFFKEDPLRVLRIARLLARFGDDWKVDGMTELVCWDMAEEGDLHQLTPERVWKEVSRALMEDHPDLFFKFMHNLSNPNAMEAGGYIFCPELSNLKGLMQNLKYHPEGCTFEHVMQCLRAAAKMGLTLEERYAVLCHDFGKREALEYNEGRNMSGHESMGVPMVEALSLRWKVPNDCKWLAVTVTRDHTHVHNLQKLRPVTVGRMFKRWNVIGRPNVPQMIVNCCTADGRGRTELHANDIHPATDYMPLLVEAWLAKVDVEELQKKHRNTLKGEMIGEAVHRARVSRIAAVKREHSTGDGK